MDIHLTPEQKQFIDAQIASGQFGNPEDVVVAALDAMKTREEKLAWLRREIQIGIDQADRGELLDGETVMRELMEKYRVSE